MKLPKKRNGSKTISARSHDHGGFSDGASCLTDQADGVDHLGQRHRVQRQDLGVAPEIGNSVVDLGHVDSADRTQVLGHDKCRVDVGERAAIEVIEILTGRQSLLHDSVDLRWREPAARICLIAKRVRK